MAIHFDTQGPAPDGFHVPTKDEWDGLKTVMTGLSLTTGDNWRINLHMPFAGYRYFSNTNIFDQGSEGRYWSSTPHPRNDMDAYYLYLLSGSVTPGTSSARAYALPIRCFKDRSVTPDNTRTQIYDGGDGPQGELTGIYHNTTLGLISISGDGTNRITIMDKNLGATSVYSNGDTLSQANMGNFYQRGNNYGFPSTGTISNTSSALVSASGYGPGNYYESNVFITGDNNWDSSYNDNLWGGVTNGTRGYPDMRLHGAIQTFHWKRPYEWEPGANTIAYYPLNSTTTNTDQSGHGNTLTNQGAVFGTYGGVNCMNGTGKSLYGSVTNLPIGNSARTISVWAYWTGGNSWMSIFGYGENNTGKRVNIGKNTSNKLFVDFYNSSVSIDKSFIQNSWGLYTFTHDGTTAKIYFNGSLLGQNNVTLNTSNSNLVISGWGAGNETFSGYISEFILEDKARTADEIAKYYNRSKSNYQSSSGGGGTQGAVIQ